MSKRFVVEKKDIKYESETSSWYPCHMFSYFDTIEEAEASAESWFSCWHMYAARPNTYYVVRIREQTVLGIESVLRRWGYDKGDKWDADVVVAQVWKEQTNASSRT